MAQKKKRCGSTDGMSTYSDSFSGGMTQCPEFKNDCSTVGDLKTRRNCEECCPIEWKKISASPGKRQIR